MLTDKHFIDWEAHYFGYGYGTGEQHTIPAIRRFLCDILENGRCYDYRTIEAALGSLAAWLLINALCHAGIFEYGTSPRHGWLTDQGQHLREYMLTKTDDELYQLVMDDDNDDPRCFPDHCCCDAESKCLNPLFE